MSLSARASSRSRPGPPSSAKAVRVAPAASPWAHHASLAWTSKRFSSSRLRSVISASICALRQCFGAADRAVNRADRALDPIAAQQLLRRALLVLGEVADVALARQRLVEVLPAVLVVDPEQLRGRRRETRQGFEDRLLVEAAPAGDRRMDLPGALGHAPLGLDRLRDLLERREDGVVDGLGLERVDLAVEFELDGLALCQPDPLPDARRAGAGQVGRALVEAVDQRQDD